MGRSPSCHSAPCPPGTGLHCRSCVWRALPGASHSCLLSSFAPSLSITPHGALLDPHFMQATTSYSPTLQDFSHAQWLDWWIWLLPCSMLSSMRAGPCLRLSCSPVDSRSVACSYLRKISEDWRTEITHKCSKRHFPAVSEETSLLDAPIKDSLESLQQKHI